jgi:xanthine dehydrogenase YagR molybdenum-binding subunit
VSATTLAGGRPIDRLDGPMKVRGAATYAFERSVDNPARAATGQPGVLAVLTHENAPKLAAASDPEVAVLQQPSCSAAAAAVGTSVSNSAT